MPSHGRMLDCVDMSLSRTFVGFSGADILQYRLMCAWKAHEHIGFDFADFQLDEAIASADEYYIKRVCRNKIRRADTYALLIGHDTFTKTTFVKWEIEVAIEKGCRLIGMNLNNSRFKDHLCPWFFADRGALFVPFSSRIVASALEPWNRPPRVPWQPDDWRFYDSVYTSLGYTSIGNLALLPPAPNPFASGRPRWEKLKPISVKPEVHSADQAKTDYVPQLLAVPKKNTLFGPIHKPPLFAGCKALELSVAASLCKRLVDAE
jgi:hypothetical protein